MPLNLNGGLVRSRVSEAVIAASFSPLHIIPKRLMGARFSSGNTLSRRLVRLMTTVLNLTSKNDLLQHHVGAGVVHTVKTSYVLRWDSVTNFN